MAIQDKTVTSRKYLSQISIKLPFFKAFVLVDNISSAKNIKQARSRLIEKPNDVNLRLSLAHSLALEGLNEEALSEWLKAHLVLPFDKDVQDDPVLLQNNAYCHYILGVILHNKGALEGAVIEWNKAYALDHGNGIGIMAKERLEEVT